MNRRASKRNLGLALILCLSEDYEYQLLSCISPEKFRLQGVMPAMADYLGKNILRVISFALMSFFSIRMFCYNGMTTDKYKV